jgi:hypothetical protein
MFNNLYDNSVPVWGIYSRYIPIEVTCAMVDGAQCTNKIKLLVSWLWDFDVGGVTQDDFFLLGEDTAEVIIRYKKKYMVSNTIHTIKIDLKTNKITSNGANKSIMFGDIILV